MPTFIKTGFWDKKQKAPKEWLNLDLFVQQHGGGGGGTNPTSTVIPYNNSGTFADSYLVNDTTNSILKSVYSGNDIGLKLDFANDYYSLGNNITNNKAAIVVNGEDIYGKEINVGLSGLHINPLTAFAELGDFNGNNNGTSFFIDDSSSLIKTQFGGAEIGINLDFANKTYNLGDFNGIYNGTALIVDDTNKIIKTFYQNNDSGMSLDYAINKFQFGDFYGNNNGSSIAIADNLRIISLQAGQNYNNTTIVLNDSSSNIKSQYQGNDIGIKLDFANYIYQFGNLSGLNGSTYIQVNDNLSIIKFESGSYNFKNMPAYANNAAALAGGLVVGDLYRNSANDALNIVH